MGQKPGIWELMRRQKEVAKGKVAGGSRGLIRSSDAGKQYEFGLFWLSPAKI